MTKPAMTKISTNYRPGPQFLPSRSCILHRDNTTCAANKSHGRFVVSEIVDGITETLRRYQTQTRAEDAICALGYTECVPESPRVLHLHDRDDSCADSDCNLVGTAHEVRS